MKVYIGADHAGFKLKESLKDALMKHHVHVIDLGNAIYDANDDYPDISATLGKRVATEKAMGVLICGSSFGVCIAANKVKGIRAVSVRTVAEAKGAREHNDANVLCLAGGGYVDPSLKESKGMSVKVAMDLILTFIKTPASRAVRHVRRREKISKLEK